MLFKGVFTSVETTSRLVVLHAPSHNSRQSIEHFQHNLVHTCNGEAAGGNEEDGTPDAGCQGNVRTIPGNVHHAIIILTVSDAM